MSVRNFKPTDHFSKPAKPYDDFPLFPHSNGCWAKKIRGKLHYFGPWVSSDTSDHGAQAALNKYLAEKDDLHAGRTPRCDQAGVTVKDVCNALLNAKQDLVNSAELTARTWAEYKEACGLIVHNFGKARLAADVGLDDFAALRRHMAARWGPKRLGNMIQYTRSVFKYGYDAGLLDKPARFGPGFAKPSKKTLRLERARKGPRLFTADEIRRMLAAADTQFKPLLLLAINAGLGNADCGTLPLRAVDLEAGIIDYPRPKTGMPRRCVLWPETIQAIRDALARRTQPKDPAHADLMFVTRRGRAWVRDTSTNPVAKKTARLLKALGVNGNRNFYALRHTFRTVADEAKDQPAVDFIMGHEVPHMSSVYRESISDARLRAVAEHVRGWLFGTMDSGRQE